ncbi:MAG: 2-amino-4-hydroxy-6-hydroxymethyldihydropteridine diphosphokinase [Tannerella sp.]|jgi:2-amino-4-hydroxy-6-hydroxymethyldihydropteridine diphosphokinase|nr:2-amino-4-hydroxy-6-hydroxymethyldihydropteridine diphosphokinase [Tannerella sp.]
MASAYLSLGSNIGNRRKNLIIAASQLAERAGEVLALSAFHETEPWGYKSNNKFLNIALRLETSLTPLGLLSVAQQIERELGRAPHRDATTYLDRTIDIDILLYDDLKCDSQELILPHPRLHLRKFVLQPLAEIAPELCHPVLHQTIAELLKQVEQAD